MNPLTARAHEAALTAGRDLAAVRATREATYALADEVEASCAALIESLAAQNASGVPATYRHAAARVAKP